MTNNEILMAKLADDVILPSKRDADIGFDLYAHFSESHLLIQPHETKMIPTGLICAFSEDYWMELKERGSTGTKGMGQRCGVIDSNYRGEIFIPITNHNTKPLLITKEVSELALEVLSADYIVYPYSKAVAQAIMHFAPKMKVREATVEEVRSVESDRGDGALGSTGK